MPPPDWVTEPEPSIACEKVRLLERLKARTPLLVTDPGTAPVVPPLPSCSVPWLIVVVPA